MPVLKGNMPTPLKRKIKRNYVLLLKEIDAEDIVPELITGGVFTLEDKEIIYSQDNRKKRTEMMIDLLVRSGPGEAYHVFFKALEKHYSHVAKKMGETPEADATKVDVSTMTEKSPDDSAKICNLQEQLKQKDITIGELKRQNELLQDQNLDLQLQNIENKKAQDRELAVMKRKMDMEHPTESFLKKPRARNDCECRNCPPQLKGPQDWHFHQLIDRHNGCLTRGKYFIQRILDEDALEAEFQRITREDLYYPPQPLNFRYAARRVFVRWAYGCLGMGIRVDIPDCVEEAIWDKYPSC